MYVYVYVYMYVYIYMCVYIYIPMYVHMYILVYVYIHTYIHVYICIYIYIYIYVCMYIYAYIHMYIHKHAYINLYIYTSYTYIIYIHKYTLLLANPQLTSRVITITSFQLSLIYVIAPLIHKRTWLFDTIRAMTPSYVPWLIHICHDATQSHADMTRWYPRTSTLICAMTHSYESWLNRMCHDATQSHADMTRWSTYILTHLRHDSFIHSITTTPQTCSKRGCLLQTARPREDGVRHSPRRRRPRHQGRQERAVVGVGLGIVIFARRLFSVEFLKSLFYSHCT